jgi:hypothetical protein
MTPDTFWQELHSVMRDPKQDEQAEWQLAHAPLVGTAYCPLAHTMFVVLHSGIMYWLLKQAVHPVLSHVLHFAGHS